MTTEWLNHVERFFALLTDKRIETLNLSKCHRPQSRYRLLHRPPQRHSKPFRWTKSADDILASIERFCRYNAPARA